MEVTRDEVLKAFMKWNVTLRQYGSIEEPFRDSYAYEVRARYEEYKALLLPFRATQDQFRIQVQRIRVLASVGKRSG